MHSILVLLLLTTIPLDSAFLTTLLNKFCEAMLCLSLMAWPPHYRARRTVHISLGDHHAIVNILECSWSPAFPAESCPLLVQLNRYCHFSFI